MLGIKGCHIVSVVSTACMLVCMPDPGRARNEMMDGVLEDLLPNFNAATRLKKLGHVSHCVVSTLLLTLLLGEDSFPILV